MADTTLENVLTSYLVARWQHHDDRVTSLLAQMTKREQALVREVAVMAGVRATMRAGSREAVPPDSAVLRDAVSACLSMSDLYPTVARLDRRARRAAHRTSEGTTDHG